MISNLSIRRQLLILVTAVILPMFAVIAYTIYSQAQQRVADAKAAARVLAVVASSDVSRVLATNRDLLVQMSKRPLIRALDSSHCDPVLWEFHELFPKSANMTTVDSHGEALCSAVPQPGGKHVMVDKAPWFKQALAADDLAVGDPFFGPITGRWVTVLTYPICDDSGKKNGFLGLPLDLTLYEPHLSGVPMVPGTAIGIVTAKGILVWRNQDTEKWVGKDVHDLSAFQQSLSVKDGEFEGAGLDGVARLYTVVPINGVDWYAYVGVPVSTYNSQFRSDLLRNGLIGLLSLLVILAFSLFVARRIERPIQALATVSRSIREGNLEIRATVSGSPELIEVAEEFNEMVDVRLRAEAALIKSEQNLQRLLNDLPAAVVVYGTDASIRFGNPLARTMLSLDEAQLLGKASFNPYWHFIRDDGSVMPAMEYPANLVAVGKMPLHDYTVGVVTAKGAAPRWISVSAVPDFDDEDGQLRQVIVCFVDITERKLAEVALARSHAELQRFAEISAHHLQEPARRVAIYAERLTKQLAGRLDDEQTRLSLEYIGQQARREQNLLHDIERYLAASQPRGEVKTTDVREAVTQILEKSSARVHAVGAEITLGDLPAAHIDMPRLKDLFAVVLDNALAHGQSERSLRIAIKGERQGDRVHYSVSDNGPGVEPEYREQVFLIFERLKTTGEGTGIGLAILRRVAESTGGRAWIEDTPGGGCCVLFDLPAGETP